MRTVSEDQLEAWGRDAERQRLKLLDAMVSAFERRREVFDVIEQSATADVAQRALTELLGVDEICAMAILDLQARRFAMRERQRIVEERDELRRHLG
jgi:DNA gyrase/topoisomerase IV subunit A